MDLKRGDLLLLTEGAALANVSYETFRYWVKMGKLPSVKPGRRRMVLRADVVAFVMRSRTHVAGANDNDPVFSAAADPNGPAAAQLGGYDSD